MDAAARETSAALRTVKSRGPDAPTLASSLEGDPLKGDGGYQARHPGEIAYKP
jgi:hypothetical protein